MIDIRRTGEGMNYKNVISILLDAIPDFGSYIDSEEDLLELPHCIFDMFFVPFVEKLCEKRCTDYLVIVGEFLESMELTNDKKLKELLNVSFLEPFILGNSNERILYLKKFLKEETLIDFKYWTQRYR